MTSVLALCIYVVLVHCNGSKTIDDQLHNDLFYMSPSGLGKRTFKLFDHRCDTYLAFAFVEHESRVSSVDSFY